MMYNVLFIHELLQCRANFVMLEKETSGNTATLRLCVKLKGKSKAAYRFQNNCLYRLKYLLTQLEYFVIGL